MPIPLRYVLDSSLRRIIPSYDPVDMVELEKLSQERFSICKSCEKFTEDTSTGMYKCNLCGCNLKFKIEKFYPFDGNGKAAFILRPNGEFITVCPEKKW